MVLAHPPDHLENKRQIDAIYKLGYSMLIVRPEELPDFYRRHHRNVHLVIRESEGSPDDLYNTAYVYADFGEESISSIPVPPPNATHLNLPIWFVASSPSLLCC